LNAIHLDEQADKKIITVDVKKKHGFKAPLKFEFWTYYCVKEDKLKRTFASRL